MSFIDNVKEAVNIVQKADNIDLYKKLLDLQRCFGTYGRKPSIKTKN